MKTATEASQLSEHLPDNLQYTQFYSERAVQAGTALKYTLGGGILSSGFASLLVLPGYALSSQGDKSYFLNVVQPSLLMTIGGMFVVGFAAGFSEYRKERRVIKGDYEMAKISLKFLAPIMERRAVRAKVRSMKRHPRVDL